MSAVSVVMVSYHTGSSLWLAIESVLAQAECLEVILVNNGNPPAVEKMLRQHAYQNPRIKLISGHGNVGFARACNMGAKTAKGDYILLLNPDCMLLEGALAKALEGMARFPEKTMAGCHLLNPNGTEQRGGRRALLTPANAVASSLGLEMFLPKEQRLNYNHFPMPRGGHELPAISGAFMLLSRCFYSELGGMDEGYFLHMEDMDLCYRVHQAGGKVVCLPDVLVVHFRSTSAVSSNFVEKQKVSSFIRYLNKHFRRKGATGTIDFISIGIRARYCLKLLTNTVGRVFEPPLVQKQKVERLVILNHITRFTSRPQTMEGKTVLVLGAGGQVGLHVVAEALARGARVIAVSQHTTVQYEHENLGWVRRDLARDKKPLEGAEVDIVVHTAGLTLLPRLLPDLCKGGAKRVVALGCAAQLERKTSPFKDAQQSAQKYAAAEKELLRIGKEQGCDVTILNATAIYGVGLDDGISRQADVIRRFGVMSLHFPADGQRQPVFVGDVTDAIVAALENPVTYGKVYAIGGATTLTYREMLEKIFAFYGKKPKFVPIPRFSTVMALLGKLYGMKQMDRDMIAQMSRPVCVNYAQATQDFGYHPRGYLEGDVGL